MNTKLSGLIAAPFTPFNSDLSLNLPMVEKQAAYLAENGVSGAFVCGTTGEGLSLTIAERMQVAEKWVAAAPKNLRVIVHVGHSSASEGKALAVHAQKIGAYAVAAIGPTFFRATTLKQLLDYCVEIASGSPSLPFYYYHMPSMTGVELCMADFLKIASRSIPNLTGIKFTHENIMDYSRCLNFEGGRYDVFFGRDEILLAALAMGAKGAVGSTYNYMPQLYHRVIEAYKAGDMATARKYQSAAIEIIAVMIRHGGLPAGKAMMKFIGIDCGPVRPPLPNLSTEALELFEAELKTVGFPVTSVTADRGRATAPAVTA